MCSVYKSEIYGRMFEEIYGDNNAQGTGSPTMSLLLQKVISRTWEVLIALRDKHIHTRDLPN